MKQWHQRKRRAAVAGLAALQLGCYTAVPITGEMARPGSRVQLDLSDGGASNMASQVGPRTRTLMGDVASTNERELVLAVRSITDVRGIESYWSGEQVTVPRTDIAAVREQRLSKRKTALFATAFVAGILATGRAFGWFSGGDGGRGDLPVTQ
jgi:hypothetical protein